jgi:hypothetical protein
MIVGLSSGNGFAGLTCFIAPNTSTCTTGSNSVPIAGGGSFFIQVSDAFGNNLPPQTLSFSWTAQ